MCRCTCTYTWCCEKGHVDTTVVLAGGASVSHWKDILVQWQISLSFLSVSLSRSVSFSSKWRTSCDSLTAFLKADSVLSLFSVIAFVAVCCSFQNKMCWGPQYDGPLFSSVVFVHVFPHVSRVVLCCQWVCLVHMYPASICQLFLWAAGFSSTSQAQVAFDNGLNRQMPGRHLAIDHGRERCARSRCSPAGEQYLRPADWPTPWSHIPVILSSFHCLPSFPDFVDVFRRAALLSKS